MALPVFRSKVERERRTVDVGSSHSGLSVRGVNAALSKPESSAGREVVDNDHAGGMPLDGNCGKAVELTPDPAAMVRTRYARRRGCEEWRPFTGRTPLVICQREAIQKRIGIRRGWIWRRLEDQYLAGNFRMIRRVSGIVVEHRRGKAFGRGKAGCHPIRGDNRHRRAVRDEFLECQPGVVNVRPAVGPVIHDVVVIRHFDIIHINRAKLLHF